MARKTLTAKTVAALKKRRLTLFPTLDASDITFVFFPAATSHSLS
jgi:hypothetical protein